MPHKHHIYAKASDMAKATMCEYTQSDHSLQHWKCFVRCCTKCPSVNLPGQETDDQYSSTSPSICFRIYHIISRCTAHGRLPLNNKNIYHKCKKDSVLEPSTKL